MASKFNKYVTNLLELLAIDTWIILRDSLELDISISEETITDINLLTIKRNKFSEFVIWKCPKDEEVNTGIDWEWFIGNNSIGWYRYAIQAKKLYLKGRDRNTYSKLKYKEQIETLEDYAKATHSIPIYCFYNYKDINSYLDKDYWLQKIWNCCSPDIDIEQLGCTVTPLEVVKAIIKCNNKKIKPSFEYIHDNEKTIPWRCLTACPNRKKLCYVAIEDSQIASLKYQQVGYYPEIPENRAILLNSREGEYKKRNYLPLFPRGEGEFNTIPKRILKISVET